MVRSSGAAVAYLVLTLAASAEARPAKTPPPPISFDRPAPVVQLPPSPREDYGDWGVTLFGGDLYIAATRNSADAAFGTMCDKTDCIAFFNPKIDCVEGEKYPVLINAPAAAYSSVVKCEKVDGVTLYSLPLEGAIADAMSVGGILGIAFPMASGEFKVSRFSLTGAARASARAAQLGKSGQGSTRQNASDSLTL